MTFDHRESMSSEFKGGCCAGSCSITGLVALGSSPALTALAIRRAWYFAYLTLEDVSGSSFSQTWRSSRNAAAANKVSAVCLQGATLVYAESCRLYVYDHLEALFAFMALSALWSVSKANCSTKTCAATSSVIVSSSPCSILVWGTINRR